MIELVVVLLGFFCPEPDLPADHEVSSVLQTGWPSETIYGASPYDLLPTTPSEDGTLSYRVIVDPLYESYESCFYSEVTNILTDRRSWPNLREAPIGEAPQTWVILSPPGACNISKTRLNISCAKGSDGPGVIKQGVISINVLRWFNGSRVGDISTNRTHIINHEIGHMLGHGHVGCGDVMAPFYELPTDCRLVAWPLGGVSDDDAPDEGIS